MVVIFSVIIGLWAALLMTSFSWGLYQGHIDDSIETYLSHLQIHHPLYQTEKSVEYVIPSGNEIAADIKKDPRVLASTTRVLVTGMVSSPTSVSGALICGVNPDEEFKVSTVATYITDGKALDNAKEHQILVGSKLAKKLKVKLKSKIVLTFQALNGDITSGSFRIAGIFKTQNAVLNEMNVYVNKREISNILGTGDGIHEIAVLLKKEAESTALSTMLKNKYPNLQSQTWKELSPELRLIIDSFNQYMLIFIGIILLALMFGIINTMLMAVLERQREIGMLMAIGMNKTRLFFMIVYETSMLVFAGIPFGVLITYASVNYFGKKGIDISAFSEGLSAYGFRSKVYTYLEPSYYLSVVLLTVSCALVSSIYPAYRALQYKPVEAIRKI